jgi:hypothetical protein
MKVLRLAAFAALITVAVAPSYGDQTNVVQDLGIQLWGLTQGGTYTNRNFVVTSVDTVRVNTRRVIEALAAATGSSLSSTSKLVVVTPLGGGAASIQIRDGSTTVDVTGFFAFESLSGSVESSTLNTRTRRSLTTDYSIQRLALQDNGNSPALTVHFDVRGVATENSMNGGQTSNLDIEASGAGDRNGNLLIIQGNISIYGGTLEVVPGGGGPIQS